MATTYIHAKLSCLPRIFSPLTTALFFTTLPFTLRWRLFLLQPINILATLLTAPSWLFNNRYSVIYIPTRNGPRRCLVYEPPARTKDINAQKQGQGQGQRDSTSQASSKGGLKPLHISIHGGGWIGGMPEQDHRFNALVSDCTGAVVVALTYRIAPGDVYPAAHDDVEDIVRYLLDHADEFGVDKELLTISGSSVGAALGMGICQYLHTLHNTQKAQDENEEEDKEQNNPTNSSHSHAHRTQISTKPLAFIALCPALDFRLPPNSKPRPATFPSFDPLSFLNPLFDLYAGTNRTKNMYNSRLHPILAPVESVPDDVLVVAAGIDILLEEAVGFVRRMRGDVDKKGKKGGNEKNVDLIIVENGVHGFLELPGFILEKERVQVFERAVRFIKDVHQRAGYMH